MPISTIDQKGLNAPLSLTAPNLGTPSAINLSNATALPKAALPTGCVLQVVQGTYATNTFNSTGSLADSGLTATITPQFASSKILVLVNQAGVVAQSATNGVTVTLLRNSTPILEFAKYLGYIIADIITNASSSYLDSPATTSATTYKTQFSRSSGSGQVIVQANGAVSTIILMEIAA